jgi:competence protein ComEC
LVVTLLDAGAGKAILLRTPGGANILIGGGAGGRTLTRALSEHLPLGKSVLDLLVVAAPREDHLGGLPDVLDRYMVKRAVLTGATSRSAPYRVALDKLYAEPGLALTEARTLPAIDLGDGILLRVLADGPDGTSLRSDWQRFALVLPIGLDAAGEADLLAHGPAVPATVMLLGHEAAHTPAWLAAVDPRLVVISTAAGSSYPSVEALARLAGRSLLRTDWNGAMTLETDGAQLW